MYGDSFNALRAVIKQTFPDVKKIYASTVPDPFVRPSFFMLLASGKSDSINKTMYEVDATWHVIYFSKLDKAGEPDPIEQFDALGKLQDALLQAMVITGPSGTVYSVEGCEVGTDQEVFLQVQLHAEVTRTQPKYDLIAEVDHIQKEGDY